MIEKFMSKLISNAQAQGSGAGTDTRSGESATDVSVILGSILKFAGAAVMILLGLAKVWGNQLDNFFGKPSERSVIFAVMAALAGWMAGYTLGFQVDVVKGNIEKIDRILNMASAVAASPKISTTDAVSFEGMTFEFNANRELAITEDPNTSFPCINGGDGKGNCLDAKNSQEFTLQRLNLGNLAGVTSSARTLERSMSGQKTIGPQGLGAARDMARAHGKLKNQLSLLRKSFNDKMNAKGMQSVDFEGQERALRNTLASATQQLLDKNGGLATLDKMAVNLPAKNSEQLEKKLAGEEKANLNSKAELAKFVEEGNNWNFDPMADKIEANLELEPEQDFSEKTVEGEGIVDNKQVSIFDVISVRYLKSAFPILFDEEKK